MSAKPYFEMLPMAYGEWQDVNRPVVRFISLWDHEVAIVEGGAGKTGDPIVSMARGFMPPLLEICHPEGCLRWWDGYVRTYLERDLRELTQVESLVDFRRFMSALAFRTGKNVNQTTVARETGLSQSTIHRYLKIVEVSQLIGQLPAFSSGRVQRLRKSPKLYFMDPALAIFLCRYHDLESLKQSRELGSFFENLVYLQLKTLCDLQVPRIAMSYIQTDGGHEVDFILEKGRQSVAVEVKMNADPLGRDIQPILHFMKGHPSCQLGLLVHGGNTVKWMHSKVLAIPWWGIGR
jgi:uncharacterized protein